MTRRLIKGKILALGLGAAAWALLGCGMTERQVTIRVANWGGAGDDSDLSKTTKEVYREFERRNPGIKIQVEGIPGAQEYVNKMLLSFVSKSEPDIMQLDASSAAVFIDNGVLQDLTELAANDPEFKWHDYWPEVIKTAERGSARYAVPLDFTPMAMYVNAAVFREAGVPLPPKTWTTKQFQEVSKKLTGKDRFGYAFSNWMPGWILWLWNRGGEVIDGETSRTTGVFDSPQNAETAAWIKEMIEVDKSAPSLSAAAALGVDLFANGQAGMTISGHWNLVGLQAAKKVKMEDILIYPLPTDMDRPQTVLYQSGLAISRGSKNKEAAWEFVKYMTSAEVQRRIQSTGLAVCARKDVAEELAGSPQTKSFLELIPGGRAPWGSRIVGYDYVEIEGTKMMDGVLQAGIDPQKALTDSAKKIDRYFEEAR